MDRTELESLCAEHGFSSVRFARVEELPDARATLAAWLDAGHHGDMRWMADNWDVRTQPGVRLPGARTAIVLTTWYGGERPLDPGGRTGLVARYAWGRDYHNQIGKRLKKLRAELRDRGVASWGGVDAAPILERTWAALAGAGFLAKNTMLIRPGQGSWFFLAVLFVTLDLEPDRPLPRAYCGRCTRCLSACPTDAFPAPHRLDARRCIAYWTIEARTLPPPELRSAHGRWVFGCDICQEVCPHNHRPPPADHEDYAPRHAWLDLDDLLHRPDSDLLEQFTGTPLRRPGAAGLKRNALIVLGNLGDPDARPAISMGLAHPEPQVRAAAVWAARRVGLEDLVPADDSDPMVQAELRSAENPP